MAEYVARVFNKGKQVMVMGKYTSWSRKNQDGTTSYGSNITANYVQVSPYSMNKSGGNNQWGSKPQGSGFQNGNNSQEQPPAGFDQFGPAESEDVPF